MSAIGRRRGLLRNKTPEQKMRRMRLLEALSALLALASAIMLWGVSTGRLGPSFVSTAASLCVAIAAYQALNLYLGSMLQRQRRSGRTEQQQQRESKQAAAPPILNAPAPTPFGEMPSVTENTTTRLDRVPREDRRNQER